jgi:hypothetical protein
MRDLTTLYLEDQNRKQSAEYRRYISNKYDVSPDCKAVREIWIYQIIRMPDGTKKIVEQECFITDGYQVKIWKQRYEGSQKRIGPHSSGKSKFNFRSLRELYLNENKLLGGEYFFSLERKTNDEVRTVFARAEREKIIELTKQIDQIKEQIYHIQNDTMEMESITYGS